MTTNIPFAAHSSKSPLRKRLLAYFFSNSEAKLYLREIAARIHVDPANLSRELARLEKEGIFKSERRGLEKYFYLNVEYALFKELKSMIFKTIGVEGAIRQLLKTILGITRAFIYGSFAKGSERAGSDVDVCLIVQKGKFKEELLLEGLHKLEDRLNREINYTFFSEAEWKAKQKGKDSFVLGLLANKRIELVNG